MKKQRKEALNKMVKFLSPKKDTTPYKYTVAKPTFTDEELVKLESLSGKEKKKYVLELKNKYKTV